jgi:hypothetical protein
MNPPNAHLNGQSTVGVQGHVHDGFEELFKYLIFFQSSNRPCKDIVVDLCQQFRASFLDGLRYALKEYISFKVRLLVSRKLVTLVKLEV